MSNDIIRKALGMDEEESIIPTENALVPITEQEDADIEADFQLVLNNLKELIDHGMDAIETAVLVAKQSQHPRSFEVLATLLKATADMNTDILNAHKKKLDIKPSQASHSKGVAGNITNNLFVGSTAELQNFLEQQKNKKYE